MKEPTTVPLSTEEMILKIVQSLEEKVDDLSEDVSGLRTQIATHEERSLNQHTRIERVEKIGGAITVSLIAALFAVFLSGCSLFSNLNQAPPAPAPEAPKVDVVARAVSNTVALHDATGSRFCSGVAAAGLIITAAHCVDEEGFTVLYRGKKYPAVVVYFNSTTDLAFVDAVGARIKGDVPVAEKMPVLGNKVIWMGYPLGEDFFMGTGIVGNPRIELGGSHYMGVYGQFIPGNSGGPVFNYKGELIGVVSMTSTFRNGLIPLGYAVPLDIIKAQL